MTVQESQSIRGDAIDAACKAQDARKADEFIIPPGSIRFVVEFDVQRFHGSASVQPTVSIVVRVEGAVKEKQIPRQSFSSPTSRIH